MFQRLITLFVLMAAMSAHAGFSSMSVNQAGFDKLTPQQQAEVIKMVAEKAHAAVPETSVDATPSVPSAERVDQWLNIGERVGKMIGGAAKEVGVAANEFVKTPVGTVAIGLIVWHYMGETVLHVAIGLILLAVGICFTLYVAKRRTGIIREYSPQGANWLSGRRLIRYERTPWSDNDTIIVLMMLAATCGFSVAVMLQS